MEKDRITRFDTLGENLYTDDRIPGRKGLHIVQIEQDVKTAGPSPFDNKRLEIFFSGCQKAVAGISCPGCFNQITWKTDNLSYSHDPVLFAKRISEICGDNKNVTIGGGEPLDQIDNLIILCKEMKKYNIHIVMYTWRRLKELLKPYYVIGGSKEELFEHIIDHKKINKLLEYVDVIIDGQYKQEERLWDGNKEDGLISSVGSGNQIVWDIKNKKGYRMDSLNGLSLRDNKLIFDIKEEKNDINSF